MHETAILLHTSNRGKKGTREGKKGAREGKKGAAPFYFGLAGTLRNMLLSLVKTPVNETFSSHEKIYYI